MTMDIIGNAVFILPVITTLFLLIILLYIYNEHQLHGKKYHPVGGTVLSMLINYKRLHHYMSDLSAKYKTYRLLSPFRNEVYTSDPANVEYILKTNFENYGKGAYLYNTNKELLGDGIFAVDGDKWREQRKVSSSQFSMKVLRDFSTIIFKKYAIKLGNILSEAASSKQKMDINELIMKATMDSVFKVGFGIDLENMSGTSEEGIAFSSAFDNANESIMRRHVDSTWKIKKFLNVGSESELKRSIKLIDDFVYKLIQMKSKQMHDSTDDISLKKEDILSKFMQTNDRDPKYLRDIVLNFLLAGKDTIAITMTWFIYMLCKHPDVQDKVAKEIKEATNVNEQDDITNVADFASCVTEDALQKLNYLHAALTETMRLYPAVPMDPKICYSDDVLPDGYNVKKGDMVTYMPYAMGRMKYLWGEDANEFKPERWLDHSGVFHPENPFKFTVFQAGPRICLGRDFAYRFLKIFSSILLGCFVFKLSDENKVASYKTTINLSIDGPLHVFVSFRSALAKS
ncbi:putative abieta-7,13-dien-18-ol hydroxylase [Helianthus annuus]|nr:putative abieta-7,13-dien-18-ol hydroxylase [Helianthus annuus]